MAEFTLCWDCKKSTTNGCSWARRMIPVKGWTAIPSHKKEFDSYLVVSCPEFHRDAWDYGRFRTRNEYVEAMIKARRRKEIEE